VHGLTGALEEVGDRRLRQPLDLQPRVLGAELVGDGQVAAYVSQADRRGEEERPLRPERRPLAAGDGTRTADADADQGVVEDAVEATGSRPWGPWPEPSKVTSVPPVSSASRTPAS
jgi:hypothetical protein